MKKILIALDNHHFSAGAFEFALRLNEIEPVLLVGLFLPAVYSANSSVNAVVTEPFFVPLVEDEDIEMIDRAIDRFENLCKENNVKFSVHKKLVDAAIPSLKFETRFADVLIIGSEMFYKNLGVVKPNEYLRYALHGTECPVLIVPEKFDFPSSNVIAYDGSESSVYAIKQFKYLFPRLCKQKTLLVHVTSQRVMEIPDLSFIEEFAAASFSDVETFQLGIDPKRFFATWLSEKKGSILITGSYGRSEFSELFRRSFINEVIGEHEIPVFIAHK